ncbi:MAG TPA: hypothetical protein VNA24_18960 [Hyalangium sp.]|nr:hypothetical protein [Hyalangium sp.]
MKIIKTKISLPPGIVSSSLAREICRRAFEHYHWFRPIKYDRGPLDPDCINFDALIAYYEEYRNLMVTSHKEQEYLFFYPARRVEFPYIGSLIWGISARGARKPAWRDEHLQQVLELMQLMRAPLAQCGIYEDLQSKTNREVMHPDGLSMMETFTVRDYSEGLPGLVWRNFFGPPFVQMFGERLTSLPSEFKQDLGGGIVLVQPYEFPTQAGTPEAAARERELIAHLGPECFYDHERHLKPTRVPNLTSLQPF